MPSRTFVSKNEKTTLGFKATKDRLILSLCTNACGFMIKSMVVYKSLNPPAFKGRHKSFVSVRRENNKLGTQHRFLVIGLQTVLFLKWRRT